MKIGVAGPVSLRMLASHFPGETLPVGYVFPPMAMWIEELVSRGHQVVVFTHAPGVTKGLTYSSDRLTIHVAPQRARGRARDFFSQERRDLLQFMTTDRCDIIHAHWTYEFAMAALDSGCPTLVTAHDAPWLVLSLARNWYRAARVLMALQVSRRATNMTAVSPDTARHFRRFLGHRGPISVIPNCLPAAVLNCAPKQFGEAPSSVVFGSVLVGWGRMKNPKPALRAFAMVRRVLGRAKFVMFGQDYEENGPAHRWAAERGLDEGVLFAGALPYDELLNRLSRDVDVLVHPSLHEALSGAVMEAMALRLAVIAGKQTPGMSYLLDGGALGKLVNVRSAGELASAMIQLGSDSSLRKNFGIAGRESVLKRFSANAVVPQYERLYAQISGRQSA
jgi:glycosyltransferase involved in cell wall biosynthesis